MFILLIFILLIYFIIFLKYKKITYIYHGENIYYKNETNLMLKQIRKQVKNHKFLKIHFKNVKYFMNIKNPKISLIITTHNQKKFLRYIYLYILKQEMKNIEIIFIDDNSTDDSFEIIYNFMKFDKRIIYVRNKINKGAFFSRNEGVLLSKGKYILIIDSDDLILNNILIKAYKIADYYSLDILQYYVVRGSYYDNKIWKRNKYKSGILYSKEVKNVFYYSVTRTLWDKLIKRVVFIKGINFMGKIFLKEKYIVHNDDTIFWGIINSANKYGFLEQIGYFYNTHNPNSIIHHYFNTSIINLIFHSLFATLKFYYFKTKENVIEKNFVCFKFFNDKIYNLYQNMTDCLTNEFDYIIDVLNLYINNSLFNESQIILFTNFQNLIKKRKEKYNKRLIQK